MRKTHIMMYQGSPIMVSDNDQKLHDQAVREAKGTLSPQYSRIEWNADRTRLFRVAYDGRKQFTGYEVRQVVQA